MEYFSVERAGAHPDRLVGRAGGEQPGLAVSETVISLTPPFHPY